MQCDAACNGVEAIGRLTERFDIIFMDVSMPQMDGFETTKAFRAYEKATGCARTIIIGLTAFSERERCLESGMDDFVQKPMMLERLDELASLYLKS